MRFDVYFGGKKSGATQRDVGPPECLQICGSLLFVSIPRGTPGTKFLWAKVAKWLVLVSPETPAENEGNYVSVNVCLFNIAQASFVFSSLVALDAPREEFSLTDLNLVHIKFVLMTLSRNIWVPCFWDFCVLLTNPLI